MTSPTAIDRHIGLDWLRIGAFALLIFYHVALFFAPGPWLVKWPHEIGWLAYPVAAIAPWRLMVLFAVSGYASAAMLVRAQAITPFFRERSIRLLVPLVFGTFVIVAPQDWVRFEVSGDYHGGLAWFWTHQELSFRFLHSVFLPNWEHLWFLAYLWLYTALLVAALAWLPGSDRLLERLAQWIARDGRLVTLPLAMIILLRVAIHFAALDNVERYMNLMADAHFMPAFLFGFVLARHPVLWGAVERSWPIALVGSALCLMSIWLAVDQDAQHASRALNFAAMIAESAMAWLMVPVAFHAASRLLVRDHPWRMPMARAIFPFYIVHQTAIVLAGFWLMNAGLPALAAFAIILCITLASGIISWQLAQHIGLLGWLLGLPPRQRHAPGPLSKVPENKRGDWQRPTILAEPESNSAT